MMNLPPGSRPATHMNTLQRMRDEYTANKGSIDQMPGIDDLTKQSLKQDCDAFVAALDWAIERCKGALN